MKISKAFSYLIPLLFLSIGLFNIGRDLFGTDEKKYAGDLVDTRFNNLVLENNFQYLSGSHKFLFSPKFFYPASNALAGSDAHLSTTPIYSFFRFIGYDMFDAFQFWVLALFLLNYFICIWVLLKFKLNIWVGSLGAFLFAFSMPVIEQTFHIQSLCKFSVPLVFYFAYKWLSNFNIRDFIFFMLSYILLFYSSIYFSLLVLIPLLFILLIFAVYNKSKIFNAEWFKRVDYKCILKHIAMLCVAILICLPIALKYINSSGEVPSYPKEGILKGLPIWRSYITASSCSYLWGSTTRALHHAMQNTWSTNFSFGYFCSLIFITSIFISKPKKKEVIVFFTCFILLILFFTKYSSSSPYLMLTDLPGFSHVSAPWRFYLVAMFPFIMVVCFALNYLLEKGNRFKYISFAFVFFIVGENMVIPDAMKHTKMKIIKNEHLNIKNILTNSKKPEHTAFVLLPGKDGVVGFENIISGMICAYECNLPCINGYTTMPPKGYCLDWLSPNREQINRWLKYFGWSDDEIENNILYIELENHPL